ncbi:hypothetical protein [Paenibacillus sp. GCM10027626]|uniref:hypothetical protein n=1 Tax=Paenibacillus sp. GCM10027626 TaxID=3273411 RepID=UPI00362D463E
MRKPFKTVIIGLTSIFALVVIYAVNYINNIGLDNLKLMYTLKTSDQLIIQMDDEGHYLGMGKRLSGHKLLKERMAKEGWAFTEQLGSGYLFEKAGEKMVITSQIWNHYYIKYNVKDNVVNIADE